MTATTRAAIGTARWWALAPYVLVSAVHIIALAVGSTAVAAPTKLLLMPLLAIGVVVVLRGRGGVPLWVLLAAIILSWLGDGAGTFVPFLPTLPMMLLFFGVAHLAYMWLFARHLAVRGLPTWTLVYALWWGILVAVLWPHLGGLAITVAAYGLVLGGTATLSARCLPIVAWGGAFFLASDTILAFRLFLPDAMPGWTSPLVMLTYCLGQGLIAVGAARTLQKKNCG